jgi:pimeloyl-ACP methyl ester carboxylesterase
MLRTAGCLPHCRLVVYSNCGHNLDTEMPEELAEEADRFLKRYSG